MSPLDPEVDPQGLFDKERNQGLTTRIEYRSRMDCRKNGCNPRHVDDGIIFPFARPLDQMPKKINNHAVTTVRRTVIYSPWEEVTP